ncbi:MAG: DUF4118 domain-containing protein [Ruminococcaceae bacterium]|nr:DUF4118 domain-containing protein [Oscillospiraceae bacterium]
MRNIFMKLKNLIISVTTLLVAFLICLAIQTWINAEALIPTVFVLAVLFISFFTKGYLYGVVSAIISVLAVNYAFTFPYFQFDFTVYENIVSAIAMIAVALIISTMTTKIRKHEAIKAEAEMEKMRANLLRAISHDIRTPLTSIYGSSSVILENKDTLSPELEKQMLKGIRDDSKWLVRMVENLLSVTKLDSGNVKITKTPTVLDELIDSVIHKFKRKYPDYAVKLQIPEDFITIPMDAILIEQVLMNLLENAVIHGKGMTEIVLKVSVAFNKATFEVSDNGCGIREEKLKSIFSGMYGDTKSTGDNHKRNTGIGLSVCSTIIKAHGGEITAENLKKGGALFRFTLDIEEVNYG